jgi:acetyl-CoA carboxylase biotin carboxyl carrier protein
MNLDDIRQILDLVREHDLAELEIERDGLKVRVRKAGREVAIMPPALPVATAIMTAAGPSPAALAGPAASAAAVPTDANGVDLAVIKSPIVGTVYRAPEPGARAFVEVGDMVKKGQVLCIIEAMKLMNEIESECEGEIAAIYVENGRPVQFGERLFAVKIR